MDLEDKKVLLIVNPMAGKVRGGGIVGKIIKKITGLGARLEVLHTQQGGDAAEFGREAVRQGFDIAIAAGGDGTINEVANGLAGSNITLGIIPLGTVNVLARELGIPLNPLKACSFIEEGVEERITLGVANGRYFLLMAGIGLDAYTIHKVSPKLKESIGVSAYIIKGIRALALYRFPKITFALPDGRSIEGYSGIVSRTRLYAGIFEIVPEAKIEEDILHLCIFQGNHPIDFLRYILTLPIKRHLDQRDVSYLRIQHCRATSEEKVYVQADGDLIGILPMSFSIAQKALRMVLPKKRA